MQSSLADVARPHIEREPSEADLFLVVEGGGGLVIFYISNCSPHFPSHIDVNAMVCGPPSCGALAEDVLAAPR